MRRKDVASTSFRRHVPTRFLINQCQIITFYILKSGNIENSRIELKGIVLQVPSNQIKVTFIIILLFNLVHLWFFPVSHRNWRKMRVNYWGGGGAKGMLAPSQIIGGAWHPLFLLLWCIRTTAMKILAKLKHKLRLGSACASAQFDLSIPLSSERIPYIYCIPWRRQWDCMPAHAILNLC